MDFKTIEASLKLDTSSSVWQKNWHLSQPSFPGNKLFFLEEDYLLDMNGLLKLPDEVITKIYKAALEIRGNEALARLMWHCHFLLFHLEDYPEQEVRKWPALSSCSNCVEDMYMALLAASGIPQLKRIYADMGISEDVLVETLDYVKEWMEDYYNKNGRWGFSKIAWFRYHQLAGKLFKLGRLEYETGFFRGGIKVYLNKNNGKVLAFSESGIEYRSDGQINGTNNVFDNKDAWISELVCKDDIVVGNPIHTDGYAMNKKITISTKEWDIVLEKGDPILVLHIPTHGKMTPQNIDESLKSAKIFFDKYFPDEYFKAYHLETWFLDSQFKNILQSGSNILTFQEKFYLYPIQSDDSSIFYWVFGGKPDDLSVLPQETHLHRAIINHYKSGKALRTGAGFILKAEPGT